MNLNDVFAGPLAEHIVLALVHFVWQGAAIALLVLVAAAFVGKSVQRRYAVSVVGLMLMVLCPLATGAISFFARASEDTPAASLQPAAILQTKSAASVPSTEAQLGAFVNQASAPAAAFSSAALLAQFGPALFVTWLGGVLLFSTRLILAALGVAWLRSTGSAANAEIHQQLKRLAKRLKMRTPEVYLSQRVSQALVAGVWRPFILLPASYVAELPPSALEAILAHELAHLVRRDLWVNLLQRVVETLLFYHPAVWWLSSRMRAEREMCCDELAVQATGERVEYAGALELVARRRRALVEPALAAGIGGSNMALLNRVRNVLGISPEDRGASGWTLVVMTTMAGGALWFAAANFTSQTAQANDEVDPNVVAFFDDEGDGPRREGPRDGDRPRPDGPRERDGDRPRPGPREGDRPKPGIPPHIQGEAREQIEKLRGKVREAVEAGNRDEAHRLEEEIHDIMKRNPPPKPEGGPKPVGREAIPAEVREKMHALREKIRVAEEDGREREVEELRTQLRHMEERVRNAFMQPQDRPRPPHEELNDQIRLLREEVMRLRREMNELRGERSPGERGPGDRPRPEGERPREGDRPRPEFRPRPEGEGRGPREGGRPQPPREGEGPRPPREG